MTDLVFIYIKEEDVWHETKTGTEFDRSLLEHISLDIAQMWFEENYGVRPRKEFIESLIDIPSIVILL